MTTGVGVRLSGFNPATGFSDTDFVFMTQNGATVKGAIAQLRTALATNALIETFAAGPTFTASISGAILTVSAFASGAPLAVGQTVFGAGVNTGQTILSLGTGTGGTGTYNLSASQATVTSEAMGAAGTSQFAPGFSTSITVVNTYGAMANIGLFFDDGRQFDCTLSGQVVGFNPTVPLGIQNVYVTGRAAIPIGVPANASVLDAQVASNAAINATKLSYVEPLTGGVARTVAAKFGDVISVKDFGATGNGVTNDTAAIQAAIAAVGSVFGGTLYFPTGNYLVSPATFTSVNNVKIAGAGHSASTITLASTGTAWTFNNCHSVIITDMAFTMSAGVSNATAVNFGSGSGTCRILQSWFYGMSQDGLQLIGTSGLPMSGHIVEGCLFLSCARYGLNSSWSEDFKIDGNQFGTTGGGATPTAGLLLDNSSAGICTRNMHWSNTVGMIVQNSHYNEFLGNRYEINLAGGVVFQTNGVSNSFIANRLYSNSQAATGTTDNLVVGNQANMLIEGNNIFTWDGTTTRYGINLGAGNSNITLKDNRVSGYSTGAYNVDFSAAFSNLGADNAMSGCTGVVVNAGATAFIGQGQDNGSANPVSQIVPVIGTVVRISCLSVSAPGAGQTYVYTLYKNNVATGLTCTTSGAASFGSATTTVLDVAQDDTLTVQVVASAGAAASIHFFNITVANR